MGLKIKNWFLDNINFCHPTLSTGEEKAKSWFFQVFSYVFWPIPWQSDPCWCCAAVRGLITGAILGGIMVHYVL